MKRYFLFYLLIIFSGNSKAQDVIVTKDNDSLNCRITKVKEQFIYFNYKHKGEYRHTLISRQDVNFFQKNFYRVADVPVDKIKERRVLNKFLFSGSGGWSYRLASVSSSVPPVFRDYMESLKSGYHFGADAIYLSSENIGFGVKYSMYRAQNHLNNIYATYPDGTTRYGSMRDDISITFIAPSVITRYVSGNRKFDFTSCLAIGYLGFKDDATLIDNFIFSGSTVGFYYDLGFNFIVKKDLAIGTTVGFTMGTLSEITKDDGRRSEVIKLGDKNKEGLGRLDLSVSLRWYH